MAQYASWHELSEIPHPQTHDWRVCCDYAARFYTYRRMPRMVSRLQQLDPVNTGPTPYPWPLDKAPARGGRENSVAPWLSLPGGHLQRDAGRRRPCSSAVPWPKSYHTAEHTPLAEAACAW